MADDEGSGDEMDRFVDDVSTSLTNQMLDRWVEGNEKAQPLLRAVMERYGIEPTINVSMVWNQDVAYITPDITANPIKWILIVESKSKDE